MWNHRSLSVKLWFRFAEYYVNLSKRNQDEVELLLNNINFKKCKGLIKDIKNKDLLIFTDPDVMVWILSAVLFVTFET